MSEEKEQFTYMVSEEKNTFRQIRNARYMNHPYPQSSSRLDPNSNNNNTASVTNNTQLSASFIPQIKTQPESPLASIDQNEDSKGKSVNSVSFLIYRSGLYASIG